jgi:hypothetical protein
MRVHPTHYTIKSASPALRSWVIESSLDGENWTEIDRKEDDYNLREWPNTASFAISNSGECCFIRLIQTGKNHGENDDLSVFSFDFFRTLLE